jgi:hypothetical protein
METEEKKGNARRRTKTSKPTLETALEVGVKADRALTEDGRVTAYDPAPMSHVPQVVYTPDRLLAMGIEKGLDLSQLEKLMDLQERWLARQAKSLFIEAKAAFQAECPEITKDKNVSYESKGEGGGKVNYDYAPLGHIAKTINPILRKYGLTYDWKFNDVHRDGKDYLQVTFILSHVAGHSETNTMEANHDASGKKNAIQARGSASTYLQRYTLIGGLGLTTADKDDDGRSARAPQATTQPRAEQNPPQTKGKPEPSVEQFKKLTARAMKGEDMSTIAKEHFTLTKDQEEALRIFYRNSPKGKEEAAAKQVL